MSVFPHSWLSITPSRAIVISGPHIQVLDTLTGELVNSTAVWQGKDKDALLKSGPVRCASTDKCQRYLATVGDDKILKVWELSRFELLNQRELPKKPTAIRFTQDAKTLLVSDKFGDIFSYPLDVVDIPITKSRRDELSSHDNSSGGQLVLGHVSLLTTFLLSCDERYIVTADRDEHIRVSRFPQGYNIERYCLGHEKYVSALHMAPFSPNLLVSGGGDTMLKIWDWLSGTIMHEVDILEAVKPFIMVRAAPRKRGEGKRDGGDTSTVTNMQKKNGTLPLGSAAADANDLSRSEMTSDAILVVHKIETLKSCDTHHIVFSAVGTSAIFAIPYPHESRASTMQVFDFCCPVLDFIVTDDEHVWVMLDKEWTGNGSKVAGGEKEMVRVVKLLQGKFVECVDSKFTTLQSSLNDKCLLSAMKEDLQTLGLYTHLSSMLKNPDIEDQDSYLDNLGVCVGALQRRLVTKKEL